MSTKFFSLLVAKCLQSAPTIEGMSDEVTLQRTLSSADLVNARIPRTTQLPIDISRDNHEKLLTRHKFVSEHFNFLWTKNRLTKLFWWTYYLMCFPFYILSLCQQTVDSNRVRVNIWYVARCTFDDNPAGKMHDRGACEELKTFPKII